jgi:hypothetical protein
MCGHAAVQDATAEHSAAPPEASDYSSLEPDQPAQKLACLCPLESPVHPPLPILLFSGTLRCATVCCAWWKIGAVACPLSLTWTPTSRWWTGGARQGGLAWLSAISNIWLCARHAEWGPQPTFTTLNSPHDCPSPRGVDFPVRQLPDASTVYYTPPVVPQRPPAYGAPPVVAGSGPAGPPAHHPGGAAAGPMIGPDVSAEDAEAIRAAMAEMEAEDASRALAAAHAAAAAGTEGTLPPVPLDAGAPPPASAGGAPAQGVPVAPAVPRSPRSIDNAVRVASNSAELLAEMLAPLAAAAGGGGDASGVGEAFITDLADQCYRWGAGRRGQCFVVGPGMRGLQEHERSSRTACMLCSSML